MTEKVYIVNSIIDLRNHHISIITSCLYGLQIWYENNEIMLVYTLTDVINNESLYFEMYGIILGSDPEGFEEDFLSEYKNTKVIAIYFLNEYVVLKEKIAAQCIVAWCAEFATHSDLPTLCEKLKTKYHI